MCEICNNNHAELKVGTKYIIFAHDCCFDINNLTGTFMGWLPSSDGTVIHDQLAFEEGFTLGPYWSTQGWSFEEIG